MPSPSEVIREFVSTRFRGSTRHAGLSADTPLFSSGVIDSFGVLELIAFLEDRFQIEIDMACHDLIEFDTIESIVNIVERARTASSS